MDTYMHESGLLVTVEERRKEETVTTVDGRTRDYIIGTSLYTTVGQPCFVDRDGSLVVFTDLGNVRCTPVR